MSRYSHCLIGVDVKPPRSKRIRRNRFKPSYTRWLFPVLVALVSLAIVIGIR